MNEITIVRNRHGDLKAETVTPFGTQRRELTISTRKHHRGGIVSDATVCQVSEDGTWRSHRIGFGTPGGDYSRTLIRDQKKRCTEKALREAHESALEQLALVLAEAIAYYPEG